MIEIGEYIRFGYNQFQGHIRKVIDRNIDNQIILDDDYDGGNYLNKYEEEHDIRNHSKNIIDLIEVGDFVNGEKVVDIFEVYKDEALASKRVLTEYREAQYPGLDLRYYLYEEDIKSVLTHEQYRRDCYRLEE